jgi:predicted secreted Zn-dependent protease
MAQWDAFMRALSLHEARHVDIAAAGARAIRREIEGISAPSCAGMDIRTRAAAERVLTAHREQDRQYDRRTRHGMTEGAVWPPRSTDEPSGPL